MDRLLLRWGRAGRFRPPAFQSWAPRGSFSTMAWSEKCSAFPGPSWSTAVLLP